MVGAYLFLRMEINLNGFWRDYVLGGIGCAVQKKTEINSGCPVNEIKSAGVQMDRLNEVL